MVQVQTYDFRSVKEQSFWFTNVIFSLYVQYAPQHEVSLSLYFVLP